MNTDDFDKRQKKLPATSRDGQKLVVTRSTEKENQLITDVKSIAIPIVDKMLIAPFEFMFRNNTFVSLIVISCVFYALNYLLHLGTLIMQASGAGFEVHESNPIVSGLNTIATGFVQWYYYLTFGLSAPQNIPLIAAIAAVPPLYLISQQVIRFRQPAYITMRADGLRPYWRLAGYEFGGDLLKWDHLSDVRLVRPRGTVLPEQWSIEFRSGKRTTLKLRLSGLKSFQERQHILDAIDQWAPSVTRDPELLEAFQPPTEHSYTELWLQSLAAPPKRDRLKPLAPGIWLQQQTYRVIRQIGAGGQGIAYLAEANGAVRSTSGGRIDTDAPQEVVLKEVILPVYLDVQARRQSLEHLQLQARILRHIDHPQIAALSDFFVEDHRGYLVLQHIDGSSLRTVVSQAGPFSEQRAISSALQMCEILGYLHGLSPPVVHRDFTPENLLLDQDGNLILIDFDVAQEQIDSTKTATVVGKPPYMPPEQIRGKPTTRSDIYALGATMFFLLTGCDPEPLTSSHPRALNDSISRELDDIVARATSLFEADRFAGVGEISSALLTLDAGETRHCQEFDVPA